MAVPAEYPSPRWSACERTAVVNRMVRWAQRGPASILGSVAIWLPVILVGPVSDAVTERRPVTAWALLAVITLSWITTVLTTTWPGAYHPRRLVLALATLTVATAAAWPLYGDDWATVFILLGIATGTALRPGQVLLGVFGVTTLALVVGWLASHDADMLWGIGIPTLLSTATTACLYLLVTVIVELVRAREELADVAVGQERLRFARDLHDLLGHTLSVIVVKAEAVRRLLPTPAAAEHAADIESIGRQALTEVRQAVGGYRTPQLRSELARARAALDAAGVRLTVRGAQTELPDVADELFGWTLREAITNVIRHARASGCEIRLTREGERITLQVSDDGHGGAAPAGAGLSGLAERVAQAHGTLTVTDADGYTVAVSIEVPAQVPLGAAS